MQLLTLDIDVPERLPKRKYAEKLSDLEDALSLGCILDSSRSNSVFSLEPPAEPFDDLFDGLDDVSFCSVTDVLTVVYKHDSPMVRLVHTRRR